MAIYGIGCDYSGKDVGNDFYTKGVACIDWAPEDKPYLYGIIKEIDIGDIIIIKSFFQRGGKQVLISQRATTMEASRKIGITEQTHYRWRKEDRGERMALPGSKKIYPNFNP